MSLSQSSDGDSMLLTPIQQREREFYNQYGRLRQNEPACFDPILGEERRPWNSYWETLRVAHEQFQPGMRLLDFGCGWGAFTVVYAKIGYQVDGFDISDANIQAAQETAQRYDLAAQISLSRQPAEKLSYPDGAFDVVAGIDILHHVDIPSAIAECHRVLKPGGVAVFREPLRNAVFDWIRNTPPVRRFMSNDASLERHITHDEEKLTPDDLAAIRRVFPHMKVRRFHVLARLAALRKSAEMTLERVDYALRRVPGFQKFAGSVILELPKT